MQGCGIAVAAEFECEASIGPGLQSQDPRTVTPPLSAFLDPASIPSERLRDIEISLLWMRSQMRSVTCIAIYVDATSL